MLPDKEVLSQVLEALYESPLNPSCWEDFIKLTAEAVGEAAPLLQRDFSETRVNNLGGPGTTGSFEKDLDLVRLLRPHIRRAYRLHSHLTASRKQRASLQSALDSLTMGVILLAREGQVVAMNHTAERMLADDGSLHVTRKGLRARRADESARLQQLVAEVAAGNEVRPAGALMISRRSRPPLQLLVSPLRGSDMDEPHSVRVIVFISDLAKKIRPTRDTLRTLFGLTSAEYRLAILLADGHNSAAIAKMVGVTRNTLKSQLASIYRKTGTSRQAQLVALLLQLPVTNPIKMNNLSAGIVNKVST